jgi:predicted nucleic acid-binding protein
MEVDENMHCVIKYNGSASFADCYAAYVMNKLNITKIYSFDSDFDNMDGLVRIY